MAEPSGATAAGLDRPLLVPPIATHDASHKVLIPRWLMLLGLVLGQAMLARQMASTGILAQAHAAVVLSVLMYALAKRNTPLLLSGFAYMPAAEIMWRQSRVSLPSGTAPYLFVFCSLVAIASTYPHITRAGRTALLYVGLLLPSTIVTLSTTGAASRELITFALGGPIALAVLVLLFSQLQISTELLRRLLWVAVISGVGPLAIALASISDYIGAGNTLTFGTESNQITSGNFGPVQVSSLLGFTVLAAVLLFTLEKELVPRILIFVIGIASMTQSLLTFSRGGMFATAIALSGLTVSQARNRRTRNRTLAAVIVFLAVGFFVVIPRIDSFTQGKFEERFRDTRSGRTTLATSDIELFKENMVFGVGPGMSKFRQISYEICQLRSDRCKNEGSSHTEFTRMPAEHGFAGIAAIVVMGLLALEAVRRSGSSSGITVAMLLWAISQMFYANLRVAAVPFAFAFAFIRIRDLDEGADKPTGRRRRLRGPPVPANLPPRQPWLTDPLPSSNR